MADEERPSTTSTSKTTTENLQPSSELEVDLSKIERAPLEEPLEAISQELFGALSENSMLRFRIEELVLENKRLEGRVDVTEEKAKLIRPFSWWVLGFVAIYCLVIFLLIFLDGISGSVAISPTVLSIMAGSTAASVIGLVAIILTGLYKSE